MFGLSVVLEKPDLAGSFVPDVMAYTFYTVQEQQFSPKPSSMDALVRDTVDTILQKINLPSRFTKEELQAAFTTKVNNYLEDEDPEFGSIIKDLLEYDDIPKDIEGIEKFSKLFSRFTEKTASLSKGALDQSLVYLYASDIPYGVIAKLSLLEHTALAFINFLDEKMTKIWKRPARRGVVENRIQSFRRLVKKLSQAGLKPRLWATRLRVYIHVMNATSMETLFEPKILSYAALDKQEFNRLASELDQTLAVFRRSLLKESKRVFQQQPRKIDPVGQTLWSEFTLDRVG